MSKLVFRVHNLQGKSNWWRNGYGKRSEKAWEKPTDMWVIVEPYKLDNPPFYVDEAGQASKAKTETHVHPGTSVFNKPLDHGERDWLQVPAADGLQVLEGMRKRGADLPRAFTKQVVKEACDKDLTDQDLDALLHQGQQGVIGGVEFAFMKSRAFVLGRLMDDGDGISMTMQVSKDRREVAKPGDLVLVELDKDKRQESDMQVPEKLLMRRIGKPDIPGNMWEEEQTILGVPVPRINPATAKRLLAEAEDRIERGEINKMT